MLNWYVILTKSQSVAVGHAAFVDPEQITMLFCCNITDCILDAAKSHKGEMFFKIFVTQNFTKSSSFFLCTRRACGTGSTCRETEP